MKALLPICFAITSLFALQTGLSQNTCHPIEGDSFSSCLTGTDMKIIENICDPSNIYLTMSSEAIAPIQMCDESSILNNPSYFSFVADGTAPFSVMITPIPGTCNNVGGSRGIQAALAGAGDCDVNTPFSIPCYTNCTISPIFLETKFIPTAGQIIVLVLDGCNGSVCDVNLDVLSGWDNEALYPDEDILEESVIELSGNEDCGLYTLSVVPAFEGLCNYRWSFPDGSMLDVNSSQITVNVSSFPEGKICVQGYAEECFPGELFPAENSVCFSFSPREFSNIELRSGPTSCGYQNGFAVAEASGNEPFTYLWSNGSTDSIINHVESGWYTVTITDLLNCEYTDSVFVIPSSSISFDIALMNPDCYGNLGEVYLQAAGGSGEYSYTWLPNISETDFAGNLREGNYKITVSDLNDPSCFEELEVDLIVSGELEVEIIEITPSSSQERTGSVTLQAKGTGEYSYHIISSGGLNLSDYFFGNMILLTELEGGTYHLTITDVETGCSKVVEFEIGVITSSFSKEIATYGMLDIFPNPVINTLYFNEDVTGLFYEVLSLDGRTVFNGQLSFSVLDVTSLNKGIYILKVESKSGEKRLAKLVKVD